VNRLLIAAAVSILAVSAIAALAFAGSENRQPNEVDRPVVQEPAPTPTDQAPVLQEPRPEPTREPRPQPTSNPDSAVSDPGRPATQTPAPTPLPVDRHAVPAPIDGLDILILESFPPQYVLHVEAGLPSGCAEKLDHGIVGRSGNVIEVSVRNSMPVGNVVCTMIYGMYELNIPLGSDFVSGQTYIVKVNDRQITFTAQ
jgi:hypothetical protein